MSILGGSWGQIERYFVPPLLCFAVLSCYYYSWDDLIRFSRTGRDFDRLHRFFVSAPLARKTFRLPGRLVARGIFSERHQFCGQACNCSEETWRQGKDEIL